VPIAALPLLKSALDCTPFFPEMMKMLERLVGSSGAGPLVIKRTVSGSTTTTSLICPI